MARRYHINPDTGRPNICSAKTPERCIYAKDGEIPEHYDTKEEAREAYAKSMAAHVTVTHSKSTLSVQQDAETQTAMIDPEDRAALESRIDAVNTRLRQLGFEDVYKLECEPVRNKRMVRGIAHYDDFVRATVHYPQLKFKNHVFLGVVKNDGGVYPSSGVNMHGYSSPDPLKCDHCNARRYRDNTYLVQNEDGNVVQVGSSCIQAYTGVRFSDLKSVDLVVRNFKKMFDDDAVGMEHLRSDKTPAWDSDDVMALSLALTDNGENYISVGKSYDLGTESTSELIRRYMRNPEAIPDSVYNDMQQYKKNGGLDSLKKEIESQLSDETDYGSNIRRLASQEAVSDSAGMLASSVTLMKRARMSKDAGFVSGFFGKEGDKIPKGTQLTLREKSTHSRQSWNGRGEQMYSRMVFSDESGHQVVWFANKVIDDVSPGEKVSISSGVVKKHSHYRGEDQTVISRVRLLK